jgi:hypothetical protein
LRSSPATLAPTLRLLQNSTNIVVA